MATYQITPPESFAFNRLEEWPKWIRRFERFRQASGLDTKGEESQINALIYTMGNHADDILCSFGLNEEDAKKYDVVKGKFDGHFVKRRNKIFERAKFNQRVQKGGESVDSFITALYTLSEHSEYGNLREEMIRDRIVVGILNSRLSEQLQLDPDLKLETAVTKVRQSEAVKQQQLIVRGRDSETTIEDVSSSKPKHPETQPGPHGNRIKGFRQRGLRMANLNLAAAQDVVNHRIISNLNAQLVKLVEPSGVPFSYQGQFDRK